MDRGTVRNMYSFIPKKTEKLVHLVSFIIRILWTSNQPEAETSDNTQHSHQTTMRPAGLEPAIPASERPQIHALDLSGTGIDSCNYMTSNNDIINNNMKRERKKSFLA